MLACALLILGIHVICLCCGVENGEHEMCNVHLHNWSSHEIWLGTVLLFGKFGIIHLYDEVGNNNYVVS